MVVNGDRLQISIDTRDQTLIALCHPAAHIGQDTGHRPGYLAGGETNAHVVRDPWFAGRVDFTGGEFGNEHAGLYAGAGSNPHRLTGVQELVHAIQHIEIDNAHQLEAASFCQPRQRRR